MPAQSSAKTFLLYTDSTFFSGAEKSFAILAKTLFEHNHQLHFYCTPETSRRFAEFVPNEKITASVTRFKLSVSWYRQLVQSLREQKPDAMVINMWSPYANTLALLAARRTGTPVLSIYHYYQERSQVRGLLTPIRLLAYRLGEKLSTKVLTVSQAHRQVLLKNFHFSAKKVEVLYNGLPEVTASPSFTDHTPRRLIAVGSLEKDKGYDFLLRVLPQVRVPFNLTIVGDGPELNELKNLAQHSPHPVTFTGRQSSLEKIYQEHDVLVHPSYFENLSMAILEAMSHGLTVIANDIGGNSELVTHGQEGWLLPKKNEAAWIEALTTACTASLESRRHAAYKRARSQFTDKEQYEQFMQYVSTILNEK